MSKTKTKRMVASFLLLCAMSGTEVLAAPEGWTPASDISNFVDGSNEVHFSDSDNKLFDGTGNTTQAPIFIGGSNTTPVSVIFDVTNKLIVQNNNASLGDGGAGMYFGSPNWAASDNSQTITINGASLFKNNLVGHEDLVGRTPHGGAIYTTSKMDFNGLAVFEENKALGIQDSNAPESVGAVGGAIWNNAQMSFNKGVNFINNFATVNGGAVANADNGELLITGGNISGNTAQKGKGGAIYSSGKVTLNAESAITFSNNTANGAKNDIYLASKDTEGAGSLILQGDKRITFNGSIEGVDDSTITTSANNLILNADNSKNFTGKFTQTGGKTTVNNKFFAGTKKHEITGGELIVAAANAIDDSLLLVNGSGNIVVDNDTTMSGNIEGNGNITLNNANLTLLNDQSVFNGTYTQTTGSLVIGNGSDNTKSFSGTNNINGGTVTINDNAVLLGENNIGNGASVTVNNGASSSGKLNVKGGSVTLENGSTLAGTNTVSGGTVDIKTTNTSGATNTISGGTVNIHTNAVLDGKNAISGGNVYVKADGTLNGVNTTISAGNIVLNDAVLNNLKEMTGGTLDITNSSVKGAVNIAGTSADVNLSGSTIEGTVNISDGTFDISGSS